MLYGASGYTGRLVAEVAVARGHRPLLAGRSAGALSAVASALGLEHRVLPLSDPATLRATLDAVDVVASCAGPFSATWEPLVDACLAMGTSYIDITGEIDVLEAVLGRGEDATSAGVVLLPGSGFDVVPTDCLAAMVAATVPGATSLTIAFRAGGGLSPGTARTALQGMGEGVRARVAGRITTLPGGPRRVTAQFPSGPAVVTSIPWGDVSTAFHSTGVPDVVTFTSLPRRRTGAAGRRLAAAAVRLPGGRRLLMAVVKRRVTGPDREWRERTRSEVWVEARAADGRVGSAALVAPNAYSLTADAVVRVVERVLAGAVPPGAHTPSTAHGRGFVLELDGVVLHPGGPEEGAGAPG
jgi:short subunit dehydrogenase-like uncharacterized protein